MRRRLVLLVSLIAVTAAGAAGTLGAAAPCGVQQVGGATVRTWCGPAKATVTWGGRTVKLEGGQCSLTTASGLALFAVNAGRYTVPRAKPRFTSFSAAGSDLKPGTYEYWLINFQTPGKQWTLRPSTTRVTITARARKGTFTGTLYEGGQTAKGSWSC